MKIDAVHVGCPISLYGILQGAAVEIAKLIVPSVITIDARKALAEDIVRNTIQGLQAWLGESPVPTLDTDTGKVETPGTH